MGTERCAVGDRVGGLLDVLEVIWFAAMDGIGARVVGFRSDGFDDEG